MNRTSLYDFHAKHGKLVEFAGYEMPLWYTSVTEEHLAVRNGAGVFDVSHMGRIVIDGPDAVNLIERLIPTSVSSQPIGKSFYTLLLNEKAGIIDDLIVMRTNDGYMMVVNAANRTKDVTHIRSLSKTYHIRLRDVTESSTMIAVQGPGAVRALQPLTRTDLSEMKRYTHTSTDIRDTKATVTRTGYTGEDGFEIILHEAGPQNAPHALAIWDDLSTRARPCGLGARDSLRIEAGLPLYGSDIDETTNPFEAELSWVVTKGKTSFIGSESLSREASAPLSRVRRGIILDDKIPRHDFIVASSSKETIGRVTSGTFSPILKKGVGMAYIEPTHAKFGDAVEVLVRDSWTRGLLVKPPFYDEKLYGWKRLRQQQ